MCHGGSSYAIVIKSLLAFPPFSAHAALSEPLGKEDQAQGSRRVPWSMRAWTGELRGRPGKITYRKGITKESPKITWSLSWASELDPKITIYDM